MACNGMACNGRLRSLHRSCASRTTRLSQSDIRGMWPEGGVATRDTAAADGVLLSAECTACAYMYRGAPELNNKTASFFLSRFSVHFCSAT
jgi:hypothetical protein